MRVLTRASLAQNQGLLEVAALAARLMARDAFAEVSGTIKKRAAQGAKAEGAAPPPQPAPPA